MSMSDVTRAVLRDANAAQALYQQVSPIIGAFDHAEMTAGDLAAYALRKLNLKVTADAAKDVSNLEAYLYGRQMGAREAACGRSALDSSQGDHLLSRYLAET